MGDGFLLFCTLNAGKGMCMKMRTIKRRLLRYASMVFAMMLCIQSLGTFASASSLNSVSGEYIYSEEEMAFINAIENSASGGRTNYWEIWNNARSLQDQEDYQGAIAEYRKVAPYFKQNEGSANMALLFMRLGECYVVLTDYVSGALCYRRSAQYWSATEGESETARYCNIKSDNLKLDVRLYLKTTDARFSQTKYFGAPHENQYGILLGTTYNDDTSSLTGIRHTLELQYFNYGTDFREHTYLFDYARENDVLLQIAFQPKSGLDSIKRDDYLIEQAKYLESTGCRILLRFANEMNDQTSYWYTEDYNKYIEKFRLVAEVFKTYAPSVGIIWAPNFYPADTIDLYYPGDEYVDYVGLSVYKGYSPESDPLGKGVDRGRWSSILDTVYDTYGDRKPIIVSESGCSYFSVQTQADITDFSVKQMNDYFTYLPIKYPNLKMAVIFNKEAESGCQYLLSRNSAVLEAYKRGITSSPRFISDPQSSQPDEVYYSELENGLTVPASKVELCSYISEPLNDIDYVIYKVGDASYTSYDIPYAVPVDFSGYEGQKITVNVRAFRDDMVAVQENFDLQVITGTSGITAVPTAATVLVDGLPLAFDAYNIDGNNYFKLRDLAYVLNGSDKQFGVSWYANAIHLTSGQSYTAVGGEMSAKGSGEQSAKATTSKIILDGEEISLTAYNIGGNNYFKLRDVGEIFDFGVGWNNDTKTITIDTSAAYTE